MAKALAEILAWLGLRAIGAENIGVGLILLTLGVAGACFAFGPQRWREDPEAFGEFGEQLPNFTRAISFIGMLIGLGGLLMLLTM